MYLFVRRRTCAPDRIADATGFAIDMCNRVSGITGLTFSAWQVAFGAPVGTFSWSTTLESHAALGEATEKLAADSGYIDAVQSGAELFVGPAEDSLVDIVATVGDGGHRGGIASLITAEVAAGNLAEAVGWGVEMMEHVAGVTGRDGLFTRSMYGPWAQVGWISLADSFEQVDEETAAVAADPQYLTMVDAGTPLFLPGSGHGTLSRRIT